MRKMTDNQIWNELYDNQVLNARHHACRQWIEGLARMQIYRLPLIEDLSIPHWKIQPILGKSPEAIFWYRLSRGIFNVNQRLRPEDQIAYLEERDLFHDTFGHLPILYDYEYTNYVRGLGNVAQYIKDPEGLIALSNLYWFTSEFGLMLDEQGTLKAYGAGVLSSQDELKFAMTSPNAFHIPIDSTNILHEISNIKTYITDGFQDRYYILPSFDYLKEILKFLWREYTN